MKLETFFEKFALFADAPNAVEKMREMVLQLAVTGKLVTQDKRDEPASVLLESTEADRSKLIAAKKIKSRPTSPVESDEQPFDLPSSWAWARLSDVGYELGQKVPDNRFTYIDVGGIDSDKGRISDRVEKLEPGDAPSRARKLVARGTVIYSTVRPYLLNIAIVDQDFDPEPIASTAFGILHPFTGIDNRYLFYWLRSAPFTAYVQAGMKGMAYPAINDEKFYSGPIALPPLAEQKRIVAKVDELMALCDRLEAQQLEREAQAGQLARASLTRFADAPTPANLNLLFHSSFPISPSDLRKSILTLAVQGKLVPQDPNDEPAEELFARIENTKEKLIKQREIKRVALEPNPTGAECELLPPGWQWTRLGNSFDVRDGTHDTPKYTTEGFPLVTSKNIYSGSLLFEGANFISEKDHRQISERSRVDRGDILFAMIGSIGNPVIVDTDREFSIKNVALFKYYSAADSEPRFLLLYLKLVAEEMRAKAAGAVQSFVSLGFLRNYLFPLPPLAEQRRIVAKVSEVMALVDELEKQLAASNATAENLFSALVAELTGTTSRLPADS